MQVLPQNFSSPLAGEAGRGGSAASAAQGTLARYTLLQERAKFMRANPTEAERALWKLLRAKRLGGMKWKRQEVIDDLYIVDFICFQPRLIVEADGSQHSDNKADVRRDAYLNAQGFRVLRFWNNAVLDNLEGTGLAILDAVESIGRQTPPAPSLQPLPRMGGEA